jgi:AraC-like DNA-binding protein
LRAPWKLALREDCGMASLELIPLELPEDVLPSVIDWIMATALLHLGAHLGRKPQGFEVRLAYPARAHHRALAELFEGELVFDAAVSCVRVPVALLDLPLRGDPQLGRLVRGQLDAQLERSHAREPSGLVEQVRERVAARIDQDACLVMVARDLRLSARTLQRQLEAAATSFNELLEDVRRAHAMRYVGETEHSVLQIAGSLGYADASSFRRAFRRWTGVSPTRFRTTARASAAVARDVSKAARKVSVA